MRVRNIPGVEALLAQSPVYIHQPHAFRGQWHLYFGNHRPLHLEIGMGKGRFLFALAQRHEQINYLGMEKSPELLWRACQQAGEGKLPNVGLLHLNAEHLLACFAPGELQRIYLNFSDPWPKARNAKRRLNHLNFLKRYEVLLPTGGELHVKTDNRELFDFGLEELKKTRFQLEEVTYDLHGNGVAPEPMTEYEEKFHQQGLKICRLICKLV